MGSEVCTCMVYLVYIRPALSFRRRMVIDAAAPVGGARVAQQGRRAHLPPRPVEHQNITGSCSSRSRWQEGRILGSHGEAVPSSLHALLQPHMSAEQGWESHRRSEHAI